MKAEQRQFVEGLMELLAKRTPAISDGRAEVAFREHVMSKWDQLVWRLAGVAAWEARQMDAGQLAQLRVLEDHPSLLHPLGKTHDELAHTTILAWLLADSSPLGVAAREALVRLIGVDVPLDDWRVTPERVLSNGRRVDLEIDVPGKWLCYIEAKVDAEEGTNQLPDYAASLSVTGAGRDHPPTLVYLTVEGRKGRSGAQPITFRDLLIAWLPIAASFTGDRATYLSCWLVTLAEDLYEVSMPGPFHTWPFATQRRSLDLMRDIKEAR